MKTELLTSLSLSLDSGVAPPRRSACNRPLKSPLELLLLRRESSCCRLEMLLLARSRRCRRLELLLLARSRRCCFSCCRAPTATTVVGCRCREAGEQPGSRSPPCVVCESVRLASTRSLLRAGVLPFHESSLLSSSQSTTSLSGSVGGGYVAVAQSGVRRGSIRPSSLTSSSRLDRTEQSASVPEQGSSPAPSQSS